MKQTLQQVAQVAAVVAVVVGCYQVLAPFIPAILFAAVACSASWPMYLRLRRSLHGRSGWAALTMTLLMVVIIIAPTVLLALSLTDNVTAGIEQLRAWIALGPPEPPAWLKRIPLIGGYLENYWIQIAASRDEALNAMKGLADPARRILVATGTAIGASVLQLVLATFIAFFFYRDGELLIRSIGRILEKLAGDLGDELLATIDNTVTGVVHGIFGTALVQAIAAVVGLVIAGVPGAILLGVATFFLSIIPAGPPLVWGGAALYLFGQGSIGWGIFMLIWGLLVISSIDNFVKPYLISRSSSLPLLLIVLGVFGGIVAFGFIGIFIGPPMLAVGLTLIQLWTSKSTLHIVEAGTPIEPRPGAEPGVIQR